MPVLVDDTLVFEAGLTVSLQRTLRLPPSEKPLPLPAGFGPLPIRLDGEPVPPSGALRYLVPLRQGEALWIAFGTRDRAPAAVQVGLGEVNAISSGPWRDGLQGAPQNYLVCPDQPWLDGINVGGGTVRQFVAAPLGSGVTIEGQVSGFETPGGLRFRVFPARPGRSPIPAGRAIAGRRESPAGSLAAGAEMGLGAGGRMRQKVYPDRYGLEIWDVDRSEEAVLTLLNTKQFRLATGEQGPPSPITAEEYARHGVPWFELYDERFESLPAPDSLQMVAPLDEAGVSGDDE